MVTSLLNSLGGTLLHADVSWGRFSNVWPRSSTLWDEHGPKLLSRPVFVNTAEAMRCWMSFVCSKETRTSKLSDFLRWL